MCASHFNKHETHFLQGMAFMLFQRMPLHVLFICKIWGFQGGGYEKCRFWDVAPCRFCMNRRFGGTYCLHLPGRKIRERGSRWFLALGFLYLGEDMFLRNLSSHKFYTAPFICSCPLLSISSLINDLTIRRCRLTAWADARLVKWTINTNPSKWIS
jgi:hypothetical protein